MLKKNSKIKKVIKLIRLKLGCVYTLLVICVITMQNKKINVNSVKIKIKPIISNEHNHIKLEQVIKIKKNQINLFNMLCVLKNICKFIISIKQQIKYVQEIW